MVSSVAHGHLSTEFCENQSSSFCVILLANKQTPHKHNLLDGGNNIINYGRGFDYAVACSIILHSIVVKLICIATVTVTQVKINNIW